MRGRMAKFTITDVQIYLIAFVTGLFLGVIFFQIKNDSFYPAMCLYHELRTDKLRRSDIISVGLLRFIVVERLKGFGLLFLTQITALRRVAAYVYCLIAGFSCAVLEGFYVQEYAIKGLVIFFATLLPHYIFYVMAWFRICSATLPTKQMSKAIFFDMVKMLTVAMVFLFVGIICESVFNVWFLKKFF